MGLKVCYLSSTYKSHARTGANYRTILSHLFTLVDTPENADIVILHKEPHVYRSDFERQPCLRKKYVIGYAVWEASQLPAAYVDGVSLVQEIWTCSHYCKESFQKVHSNVHVIPHVAARASNFSEDDRYFIARQIPSVSRGVYYLNVTRLWDKRKNIEGLVSAFAATREDMPDARLIIKTTNDLDHLALSSIDSRIVPVTKFFSEAQMNALYAAADVYVSPHRSEGWGLCISDAMALGCLVAASDFAGPKEYLTENNSILFPCGVTKVTELNSYGFFDETMLWGEPDLACVQRMFRKTYATPYSEEFLQKRKVAKLINETFSSERVEETVRLRMASIAKVLYHG